MSGLVKVPHGNVILYEAPDGEARVEVKLDRDTVWLTQDQMSWLFGRERSVVTKHVRNVFRDGELDARSVCAKFAHTAADGKTYQVDHFNLDVIISVGYRVKSVAGTRFRQWATNTLRDHLVQGYMINRPLADARLPELPVTIEGLCAPRVCAVRRSPSVATRRHDIPFRFIGTYTQVPRL